MTGYESFNLLCTTSDDYPLLFKTAFGLQDVQAYELISLKPIISYKTKKQNLDDKCFYEGYVCNPDSTRYRETPYTRIVLDSTNMKKQFAYLEKCILLCKEKNKELIFLYAPIPKELPISNEDFYYEKINALTKKHNIKFLDMSHNHSLNSQDHFYDNNHLNVSGVKIFNENLFRALQ